MTTPETGLPTPTGINPMAPIKTRPGPKYPHSIDTNMSPGLRSILEKRDQAPSWNSFYFEADDVPPATPNYTSSILLFSSTGRIVRHTERIDQTSNPNYFLTLLAIHGNGCELAKVWTNTMDGYLIFNNVQEDNIPKDREGLSELLVQENWELEAIDFLLKMVKLATSDVLMDDKKTTDMLVIRLRALAQIIDWKSFLERFPVQSPTSQRFVSVLDTAKTNLYALTHEGMPV